MSGVSNFISGPNNRIPPPPPVEQLGHLRRLIGHLHRLVIRVSDHPLPDADQLLKIEHQWKNLLLGALNAHAYLPPATAEKLERRTIAIFQRPATWDTLLREDLPIEEKKEQLRLLHQCTLVMEPNRESNAFAKRIRMTNTASPQKTIYPTTSTHQTQEPTSPIQHTQTTSTTLSLSESYPMISTSQTQETTSPIQYAEVVNTVPPQDYNYPTISTSQTQETTSPIQYAEIVNTVLSQNYSAPVQKPPATIEYTWNAYTTLPNKICQLWKQGKLSAALDLIFEQPKLSLDKPLSPLSPERIRIVLQYISKRISSDTPFSKSVLYSLLAHLHQNLPMDSESIDCILGMYQHPTLINDSPRIIRLLFSPLPQFLAEITEQQMQNCLVLLKETTLTKTTEGVYVEALDILCRYILEEQQISAILYNLIPKLKDKNHPLRPDALLALLTQPSLTDLQVMKFSALFQQLSKQQQLLLAEALRSESLRQPLRFPTWVPHWILDLKEDDFI